MRSSITRIALLALAALPLAIVSSAQAVTYGPELAPNRSFEDSPTDPTGDVTKQPLLPTGWAFEGAAGLFDHSEHGKVSGRRMIAISAPASTPRVLCAEGTCTPSPLNTVKDQTAKYYSVTPYWRTVEAVPVTGGKTYNLRVWTQIEFATASVGGAVTKVRWVDANGLVIRENTGPKLIQSPSGGVTSAWTQISGNVPSPSGAAGAIIMLGAADDLWLSQTRFDDVSFRQITG